MSKPETITMKKEAPNHSSHILDKLLSEITPEQQAKTDREMLEQAEKKEPDSDAAKLEALAHWFDVFDADDGSAGLANNEVQIDLRRIAQKLKLTEGQSDQESKSIEFAKWIRDEWFIVKGRRYRHRGDFYKNHKLKNEKELYQIFITRNTPKP